MTSRKGAGPCGRMEHFAIPIISLGNSAKKSKIRDRIARPFEPNGLKMAQRIIVFGGTGFLGRRIVSTLATSGATVGVAARHPRIPRSAATANGRVTPIAADVTDASSVARAVDGADAVVNCVGLYVESGALSLQAIHVRGARNVATAAAKANVDALIHVSGIGSTPSSSSAYIRARGDGEAVVRNAFPDATILRPSVIFGAGDALLSGIAQVAAATPVIPLFGYGDTRLQPVFVDDVAAAVARAIASPAARGAVYELGGPEILTYREIVERVLEWTGHHRVLLPFPFMGWELLTSAMKILPSPPLTDTQVALMKNDNVVGGDARRFADLGLTPRSMAEVAPAYLAQL
jgi:uncharacterized protein YbjT (DUF2867 family)